MGPLILAVDTTGEFGSLALSEGETLLEEILLHSPEGFGHILFPQIERLLDRHECSLHDVDCFAGLAGPGSFTGVRIGLTAVKGLSEATGRPAVAVSNLEALASFGGAPLRAPVLDARRGEIYGAVYDAELNLVVPEVVAKFTDWLSSLPAGHLQFLAHDFTPFEHALAGTRFAGAPVREVPRALAAAAASIAARRYQTGAVSDPAALDANYVRRSDAELLWKDR